MTSPEPEVRVTYAWCFSHGLLHTFHDEPWCTAMWMTIRADSEADALARKEEIYGDAQFDHHLPTELRLTVYAVNDTRPAWEAIR